MRFIVVLAALCATVYAGFTALAAGSLSHLDNTREKAANAPVTPPPAHYAGLWDKPNEACIAKCEGFVKKGCFAELTKKNPTASPVSIQDQCDDKYSLCLYDCMCDTCDENQIIIKQN